MKILYPSRCFVIETDDKQYKMVKMGDIIRIYNRVINDIRTKEGAFVVIDRVEREIVIDCSKDFKSNLITYKLEDIVNIEIIKENEYEGNYLKEK